MRANRRIMHAMGAICRYSGKKFSRTWLEPCAGTKSTAQFFLRDRNKFNACGLVRMPVVSGLLLQTDRHVDLLWKAPPFSTRSGGAFFDRRIPAGPMVGLKDAGGRLSDSIHAHPKTARPLRAQDFFV